MSEKFHILMLEDQPADAELAGHALRQGGVSFTLTRVETQNEFLAELEHRPPDLILSDHALPDFDGFTALALTKKRRPDIPFIFFTGSLGEDNAIKTLRHGATDYVLKHRLSDLVPAVLRAAREHQERVKRLHAEEALRHNEERFRALIEKSSDIIVLLDIDGRIRYASESLQRILGYAPSELEGTSAFDLAHPEDLPQVRALFSELPKTPGHSVTSQHRYRHKNGEWRWLAGVGTNLLEEPSVKAIVANLRDITVRKRAEDELEVRMRQQAAVSRFGQRALATKSLYVIMNDAVSLVAKTLGLELCKILELLPGGKQFLLRAGFGWEDGLIGQATVSSGLETQAGFTLSSKHAVTFEDLQSEKRFGIPEVLRRHEVVSGLSVIIPGREWPFGILAAFSKERRKFTRNDIHFLETIANLLTTTIERARDERSLQKYADALREQAQVLELAQVIIRDMEGHIVYWNHGSETMYGWTREQAVGRNAHELFSTQFSEPLEQIEKRLLKTGAWKGELIQTRRDGSQMVVATLWLLHRDGQGHPLRVLEANNDITDQKRAEEKLHLSEERFRLLVEGVTDYAIYMLDPEGRVVTWNAGAERLEGYEAEEIIGKQLFNCVMEGETEISHPTEQLKIAAVQGRYEGEGWCERKDGSRYYANWIITAMRDDAGNLTGFSKVSRDITEAKRAEEKIHKLTTELERRVVERTAQLEAAYEELEAFSYSVSHDLRAPLRHIDGFVDILQTTAETNLNDVQRHHLQTISDAAKQMGRLIDDLLAFSKMSRAELTKIKVNMAHIIEEVKRSLRRELEGRKVSWIIGKLPEADGDPSLLRQVWINLITNALKYTRPRKEARIEIGALETADEFVYLIRDNGVGFDMRYVDKLFGVFQRLHRTNEFEGTGIGLANVRRIVHRHGGRTWAESELHKGATFYFSLPKRPNPVE